MKLVLRFADNVKSEPLPTSSQLKKGSSKPSRRSLQEWELFLEQWEASGLTQKKFCEQHKLSLKTFACHRTRQLSKSRSNQTLLPIKISDSLDFPSPAENLFTLKLASDATLMIPVGFDKTALKELLIILGVC